MSTVTLPLIPTDELVAVAWIGSIPGLSVSMVATQLPADANRDGTPADWVVQGAGFVTVTVVGGGADPILPVRKPVMQVDCWATLPGSNKPPWGIANRLAETIRRAAWSRVATARPLTITVNGVVYPRAAVMAAAPVTAPRRLWDDAGDYARYQFDLGLVWTALTEVLD